MSEDDASIEDREVICQDRYFFQCGYARESISDTRDGDLESAELGT